MNDEHPFSRKSPWATKEVEKKEANALWRVPTWFPEISSEVLEALKKYHLELLKFNLKLNLISKNTEREADEVHFADCICAAKIILKPTLGQRIYDFGSGNGFPGLLLAILDPKREFVLIESDLRKTEFLRHISFLLGLKNVSILNLRLEALHGADIEIGISRGFASISKSILSSNRVFKKNGILLHMKGLSWSREVAEIPSQIISVWRPELLGEYTLPGSQNRRAVVVTHKKV